MVPAAVWPAPSSVSFFCLMVIVVAVTDSMVKIWLLPESVALVMVKISPAFSAENGVPPPAVMTPVA